jgi:hypothetical protein
MTKKRQDRTLVMEHINKAYSEISKVRHVSRTYALADEEYKRLLDIYRILGLIRTDQFKWEDRIAG